MSKSSPQQQIRWFVLCGQIDLYADGLNSGGPYLLFDAEAVCRYLNTGSKWLREAILAKGTEVRPTKSGWHPGSVVRVSEMKLSKRKNVQDAKVLCFLLKLCGEQKEAVERVSKIQKLWSKK